MSETTTSDEPVTGPIEHVPPPPPPTYTEPYPAGGVPEHTHPKSRLSKVLTWVGIIAGSLFIVAIIFSTGFRIGLAVGSHGGGMGHHRHHHDSGQMDRGGPQFGGGGGQWHQGGPGGQGGPGFVFPGGPGFFPGFPGSPGGPGFPGGPGGQGGAGGQGGQAPR
jgi:hypothetical protein